MNSQILNSINKVSSSFELLDRKIQKWIWEHKWEELRDIQEIAIPKILNRQNVIIASATASGKTEAAFFPILTYMVQHEKENPVTLYISPLKALINDQWRRLVPLCERLKICVTPWHGDITQAKKNKFFNNPKGCVLITPESLEALLINHGFEINKIFRNLKYCVIDEIHSFIGNERGKQLQSLLYRLNVTIGLKKNICCIGLSATLGDLKLAANYLNNNITTKKTEIITSKSNNLNLKLLIYGYKNNDYGDSFITYIAQNAFKKLRDGNHLIFPNKREMVESIADKLRVMSEEDGIPNQFFPHHGNLSKEIREKTEYVLKKGNIPATVICTSTLELGIDIGAIKSVMQINPPPSVSSLRQRIGRSGRKNGEPSILRMYDSEQVLTKNSALSDLIREQLIQCIAVILLLIDNWCETPNKKGIHYSTFIQQILSAIAQYGGIMVNDIWQLFCNSGIFTGISQKDFLTLLSALGKQDIITQDESGLLLLGNKGERIVNHFTFYAAFSSDDEYRILSNGTTLGTLPISLSMKVGTYIIFAGKRWIINDINSQQKVIIVRPDKGGKVPKFTGSSFCVDRKVRKKMREVLSSNTNISFLDDTSKELLSEARFNYKNFNLDKNQIIVFTNEIYIIFWDSDIVSNTLAWFFESKGYTCVNTGLYLSLGKHISVDKVLDFLHEFLTIDEKDLYNIGKIIPNKDYEKWDHLLPEELKIKNYISRYMDIIASKSAVTELLSSNER